MRLAHDNSGPVSYGAFTETKPFQKPDSCILKKEQILVIAHMPAIIDFPYAHNKTGLKEGAHTFLLITGNPRAGLSAASTSIEFCPAAVTTLHFVLIRRSVSRMDFLMLDTDALAAGYLDRIVEDGVVAVAVDIEAEFNLHVYGERLCLIQLFDGRQAAIIDPHKVSQQVYRRVFESRDFLKVTYDSASDRSLLLRTQDISMFSILDLKPAVELLQLPRQDLSSVLSATLDIRRETNKRFQTYDWTRRPISETALAYAVEDVLHLLTLKENLTARIRAEGLDEHYQLKNLNVQNAPIRTSPHNNPHLRIKGARKLNRSQASLLKHLFAARDTIAREHDFPPHLVLRNDILIELARGTLAPADIPFSRRINPSLRERITNQVENALHQR